MDFVIAILVPFALGCVTVGAYTWRTLSVFRGDVGYVIASSIVGSFAGFWGIMYIVHNDIPSYIAFGVGSTLVTSIMAAFNRRRARATADGQR